MINHIHLYHNTPVEPKTKNIVNFFSNPLKISNKYEYVRIARSRIVTESLMMGSRFDIQPG